ncbi:hypothetical protein BN1080_02556 [Planococcus massiliensis]|uniref:WVELL protein n=1 Tax=Planococcus massiliensis TaxID=1499687 RepID=A0A098EMR1_9BACL|nr:MULTISPECIES: YfhJ family protein [Planococcus]MCJ1910185.1 YfhJ family protein [Planococcus ruber]CEG23558.1 hypothetical protein BN1080_02556 [Planococcus massiliensis]
MNEIIDQLVIELLEKNTNLSEEKARTWIELLVSDFEASYAKAGYDYQGTAVVEKVIRQWISSYGDKIHEFAGTNPKYAHLLED